MGSGVTKIGRASLAVAGALLAVLVIASPASAHNSLTSSDPRNGARLAKAPAAVRLTFLDVLDKNTTKLTVAGPGGAQAAGGAPTFAGNRVSVPLRAGAAGIYTVAYEVLSADGDRVRGRVRFTLTVPATTPAPRTPTAPPGGVTATTPAGAGSPTAAAPTTAPALTPSAAAAEPADDGTPWWPYAVVAAVLAAGAATAYALRRRRTP